ncbi:hypothetical protein [Legionella fallonii]|uniref:Uncharacterized protein n=1 Tax=Legionella fallonii LLAP-10 TaxID=1212491 RepID=A0A098G2C3_9GAMM|nr:hypothetical protein [Legionella fallonii]CEG56136.1 protein of unknown function [Legionella fallonii LLAP-10]
MSSYRSYKSYKKSLSFFCNEIDSTYDDVLHSVIKLIHEGLEFYTPHIEINFILRLISKLRHDFEQNPHATMELLEEMLKGGHLKLVDDGSLYNELVATFQECLHERSSSHESSAQQYSFSGPVVKEVLFGVSYDENGNRNTWIQFEKHNTRNIFNLILHLLDYIVHKFTGKNVGPFGLSEYTEQNPLVLSA